MKIKVDPFNKASIDTAIKQVQQYKKDFLAKEELFVKRLGEIGVSVATTGFAVADYDGIKDVTVRLEWNGNKAVIIAEGETVGFIEFGTGIRNPEWDNSGMDYTPPKHGTYGKKRGARPHGWYFKPGEGAVQHTFGNPPAEAMRTARDVMIERIARIAREVFR